MRLQECSPKRLQNRSAERFLECSKERTHTKLKECSPKHLENRSTEHFVPRPLPVSLWHMPARAASSEELAQPLRVKVHAASKTTPGHTTQVRRACANYSLHASSENVSVNVLVVTITIRSLERYRERS